MSTLATKKSEVQANWHYIDADGMVVGRLASNVIKLLIGKHKVNYSPNLKMGDHVVVINSEKVMLTGTKLEKKKYYRHSGMVGKLKTLVASQVKMRDSNRLIYEAVKGMLPKNRLRKVRLSNLHIYAGATHPHYGQIKDDENKK